MRLLLKLVRICVLHALGIHQSTLYDMSKRGTSPAIPRSAKLVRFDKFRRTLPHLSVSALNAVLAKVRDEGLPELHTTKTAAEATQYIMNYKTPYGPLLHTVVVQGKLKTLISDGCYLNTL